MLTILLLICLVIWLPVLLYQIKERAFLVLVIWLFVAPVAVNLVSRPNTNPFFQTPAVEKGGWKLQVSSYNLDVLPSVCMSPSTPLLYLSWPTLWQGAL